MKDQIGEIVADLYKETLIYATSENASKVNLQAYIDKLEAMGGWQDISTAPKDGTRVLLWNNLWSDSNTGYFGGLRGWYQTYVCGPFVHQPTHWRPLPLKPTGEL